MKESRITIIGGGFTGASVAIQLLRRATHRIAVRIVDPREALAEGLAFSSSHRDHRLNGPASGHSVFLDDPQHLLRWCARIGLASSDPEAVAGEALFIRRADFARYVRDTLSEELAGRCDGSSLVHVRDEATAVSRSADGYEVGTRE